MIGSSLGPYRIIKLLGSGGMGEVYLAEDGRLGRKVAVKVLPPEFAGDAARMARFEQEARATSALNHPGICTLHDIGTHEGQPFLVMEALEGQTLHEAIGGSPLPTDRLLGIAIQVSDALGEAHGKGVIHRDLKSANIFVTSDGRAKILDFGLAKLTAGVAPGQVSSMPTSAQLTREGATLGTVAYMSPEQARGQTLDARSDLFSFGVVLYEMATGKVPFEGTTEAVVFDQILNSDPRSAIEINPRLPTGLVQLIGKALQKDPAARFASASDIGDQLEEIRRAPGSLDSILPAEHISSTAPVKPPPRPEEQFADHSPDADNAEPDATPDTPPAAPAVVDPAGAEPAVVGPAAELPIVEPAGAEPADQEAADGEIPMQPPLPLRPGPSSVPTEAKPSIAVLPFESMSLDPEDEFFAAGLSEEIINALAHLDGLDVAARTSAFSFKGKHRDVREIGDQLGVGTVLEGSVRRAGNRLRITAQLVKAADGYHLWSERYDREMEDIFVIQDEITEAIVNVLEVHLAIGQSGEIAPRATTSAEAYELCLKGRHFWAQRRPQTMLKAIDYFKRAIEIDPQYAIAYAGLADGYATLGAYQVIPPTLATSQAWPAIERATELDPTLSEPHFSKGFVHMWFSDNWLQGEPHFRRALELDPRNSTAHVYFGEFLAMAGRYVEAVEHAEEAKRVDPLSSFVRAISALVYRTAGNHEASIETLKEALEIDPDSTLAKWLLAFSYRDIGRIHEALDLAEEVAAAAERHPTFLSMLGYMHAVSGNTDEALAIMSEIEERSTVGYVSPLAGILIYAALGDMHKLLPYVREMREQGGGVAALFATNRGDLDALRDDPIAGAAISELPLWLAESD